MTRRSIVSRPIRLARARMASDGRTGRSRNAEWTQIPDSSPSLPHLPQFRSAVMQRAAGRLTVLWTGSVSSGRLAEGPRRRWRRVCARLPDAIIASQAAWCAPIPAGLGRDRRVPPSSTATASPCRLPRTAGAQRARRARPVILCRYGFLPSALAERLPTGPRLREAHSHACRVAPFIADDGRRG